jgi:quercetin dioxygenase-like cupin family protein
MSDPAPELRPLIVPPDAGTPLDAFGDHVVVKLDTEQTGGVLFASVSTVEPGSGPPLHRHGREHEVFYVLEGTMSFFADGAWTDAGPGTFAFLPRGQAHTFQNRGDATVKMLILTLPSGFEKFFAGCAQVFGEGQPPDLAKIMSLAADHEIEFLPG